VANLLCRLFDPTSGKIKIDGVELKDYDLQHYRSQLGYVPQDVFLFSDSIFNNIAFGSMNPDPDDIVQASKEADLFDNISQFPEGFNTKVGERGVTLSGGQKQRVCIARAISRKPKILILDDALSAVDTKTENSILQGLERIMVDKTTVIISHRISSAKLADKIICLDDGEIVEQGTHETLLKIDGAYRELHDKQLVSGEYVE